MVSGKMTRGSMRFLVNLVLCLAVSWLLPASDAYARPTSPEQARLAVANWIVLEKQPLGVRLGQQVKQVQTFADINGPLYFVVQLEPAGLVFVPGDDLVEPIVGFAEAKVYDPSPANPVGALVNRDIPGRVVMVRQLEQQARAEGREFTPSKEMQTAQRKWEALQQGQSLRDPTGELQARGLAAVEDVWVAPLVQSAWNQRTVDDTAATPHCYDYYTNWLGVYYYCGCTATAMAQVMRKWEYPPSPNVGTFPITVGGNPQNATIRGGNGSGGAYNWGLMELDPLNNATTEAQREAIGALTYDAGVAALMDYGTTSSGAWLEDGAAALRNTFKYSSAVIGRNIRNNNMSDPLNIPTLQLYDMVNTNLDAGYPVLFHIAQGGANPYAHSVVGDGYGNHWGTWYHHLNMGWGGSQNLYYNLPTIDSNPVFSIVTRCAYNIYVSGTGEIISGRVTDSCGRPVDGVTVTATGPGSPPAVTSDSRGIYAFAKVASNATYTLHASGTGYTDQTVTTGVSVDKTIGCGNRWGVNFRATKPIATNPEYVLYNLGGLDLKVSVAYGINNNSIIVGGMRTSNTKAECNPCVWYETTKGQFAFQRAGTDIADYGYLHDINDNNLAVGWAAKSTWSPIQEQPVFALLSGGYFVYNLLPIPTEGLSGHVPFGKAFGVNSSGQIVGQAVMSQNSLAGVYPAYWPNTTSQPQTNAGFGNWGGTSENWAARINDSGVIAGKKKDSLIRAFLWNGGSLTWLGPTDQNSEARSLTNLNPPTVVGLLGLFDYLTYWGDRAVTFSGSTATPLDSTLGKIAHGINNIGQIVGGGPAFIYDSIKGLRDLNTLVNEPDWNLTSAFDINENGEIVGEGWFGAGHCYSVKMAYLLRPLFTITATAGPGGVIAPNGAVKVVRGDNMTFTIIPNPGFSIASVVVDGANQGAISSYTFTNVTANHTISATFTGGPITHTITASAGSGGSIVPSGAVTVADHGNQTFTITPLAGFNIAGVTVDGDPKGAISTYTFNDVTGDHTISASFVVKTFTITASAGTGGTISPPGNVTVNYGDNKTFTIAANSGYQISDVVVDGTTHLGAVTSHTFTSVTANHTIAASFTPITSSYTITASAGTGGTISPNGGVSVNAGTNKTFTITPNTGYRVLDVVVDGTTHLGSVTSHTFTNVQANHTIAATFAVLTFTLTPSAGTGGTISPSQVVTVDYGGGQTFTITPNSGFRIVDVAVDGTSQGAITSYPFTNVQANHTISATFAPITASYTITASAELGGSISPSGVVTVNSGGSQVFAITPSSGYEVLDVQVDGVSQGQITSFTFTNVTANHTITARFRILGACQPFFDHFEGTSLGNSWTVKNPDQTNYSISNSRLHTQTLPGDLWEGSNDYKNLFLIQNPMAGCDFRVTIKVLGFNPTEVIQQIGIVAYDDDDNFIMANNCYFDPRQWEFYSEVGGVHVTDDYDPTSAAVTDFYLRLVKVGNTYRQFFSVDGVTYQERNQQTTYGNGSPKYLGFIALEGSGITATPVTVDIDFFAVEKLQGYPSLPLLLGFYPFEGSAQDASGNGKNGQVTGATLTNAGYEGQAYTFNGTDNYIQAPLNINPSQYPKLTMGAWAKSAASDGRRQVISHDNGSYDRGQGIFGGYWGNSCGSGGYQSPEPVVNGKWTFLASVYDQAAGTVKLWVDDKLYIRTGVTLGEGFDYLRIGSNPGFGEYFNGTIDNVFFFNGALTDAQVYAIKNGGSAAIKSAIVGGGKSLSGVMQLLMD